MDKIQAPRGLIRYASMEGIEQKKKLKFNARIASYCFVLLALLSVLGYLLATRSSIETTILRAPGLMYQENKDGTVSNLYNVQVVNKSYQEMPLTFHLKGGNGTIKMIGNAMLVKPSEVSESAFFIFVQAKSLKESSVKLEVEVISEGKIIDIVKTKFQGPVR
jgi:polyferredoxin